MGSIRDKLKYLSETKVQIRKAIVSRGVDVDRDATFRSYAEKIRGIKVYDTYEGPYTVGPSLETIVMPTFDKAMLDDVTVEVYPEFEGSYTIAPSVSGQTVQSKDKVMTDNIIVQPLNVYDGSYLLELVSIGCDLLPTKTVYSDGESIDLTGAVIIAYYKNGDPWEGVISLSDVSFTPTKADKSKATPVVYTNDDKTINAVRCVLDVDGHSTLDDSFHVWFQYAKDLGNLYTITNSTTTPGAVQYLTKYNGRIYSASETGAQYCDLARYPSEGQMPRRITANTQTVGVGAFLHISALDAYAEYLELVPESASDPSGVELSTIHKEGGEQTITLSWERVGDGKPIYGELKIKIDEQGE